MKGHARRATCNPKSGTVSSGTRAGSFATGERSCGNSRIIKSVRAQADTTTNNFAFRMSQFLKLNSGECSPYITDLVLSTVETLLVQLACTMILWTREFFRGSYTYESTAILGLRGKKLTSIALILPRFILNFE